MVLSVPARASPHLVEVLFALLFIFLLKKDRESITASSRGHRDARPSAWLVPEVGSEARRPWL